MFNTLFDREMSCKYSIITDYCMQQKYLQILASLLSKQINTAKQGTNTSNMEINHLILFFLYLVGVLSLFSCGKTKQQDDGRNPIIENVTLQTILNRKSVRTYTGREITDEQINLMLRAGMSAPSSRDRRPWHLMVISDKSVLNSLGSQLKNATIIKNANKAIIVCGDDQLSDNCWFLDCAAVTQNILLAAESMGIGAVWTAVYPYEDRAGVVNKMFQLPEHIHALAIIPLGYPEGRHTPKNKFDSGRIHYNKW